ncbi:unnamed protein product [Brachionus calyciflorus]|uniref:Uncharacterized protein n=1 Tax=Brachionus calyciflorus TaxID=104777 RepID=A0A814CDL9_9BILA|nr:unnamed protein product [Brachionus calyciflorus]
MPFGKRRQNFFDNCLKYPNAREVKVSIMFTRLAEIDTINERFSCEATLFITWCETSNIIKNIDDEMCYLDPKQLWDPQLYIDNAIGDVKEKDVKYRVERFFNVEKQQWQFEIHMIKRIQGTFFEKLELYHFPFDVQDLSIILTSHRTLDEINLIQDYKIPAKMTKSASLDKHIWKLYDHVNFKVHTIKSDLPPSSEYSTEEFETSCSHPAITMQCRVSRKPGYFIINCLLPTLMITVCVFFTFLMDYSRIQYRFSLLFTTMLTSITFRWAIHGRVLPTISYMTFLDVYCVSSILIVFSAMVWHAMYIVLHKRDVKLADRFDNMAIITFAIIVILIHIMQTIWFFIAFKKRLIFESLDKKAALDFVSARLNLNKNSMPTESLSEGSKIYSNNLTNNPKRMLYSFSKLDENTLINADKIRSKASQNLDFMVNNNFNRTIVVDEYVPEEVEQDYSRNGHLSEHNDSDLSIASSRNINSQKFTQNSNFIISRAENSRFQALNFRDDVTMHNSFSRSSNLASSYYVDRLQENEHDSKNYQYLPLIHQSSRDS